MQPGTPGTPPFWNDISAYRLDITNSVSLVAVIEKNVFPSTFWIDSDPWNLGFWNVNAFCLLPLIIDRDGRPHSLNEGMQQAQCLGTSLVQEIGNSVGSWRCFLLSSQPLSSSERDAKQRGLAEISKRFMARNSYLPQLYGSLKKLLIALLLSYFFRLTLSAQRKSLTRLFTSSHKTESPSLL